MLMDAEDTFEDHPVFGVEVFIGFAFIVFILIQCILAAMMW